MGQKIPETVALIHKLRRDGLTFREITEYLEWQKVKTARGGSTWNIRQVQLALKQTPDGAVSGADKREGEQDR